MPDIHPDTGRPPSFTQASEQGSDTGTDGYVPQPLDKALLGGAPQLVGTFEYRYDTGAWSWSDTVARLHGYEPGTVQPTTELVLSHKHPDDLAEVKGLLKQSAAPFSSRHRIRTVSGEIRRVVVVGTAVFDEHGKVVATRGFYIDVTQAADADVQGAIGEELREIMGRRELIEQAKGILMVLYRIDSDAAFGILRWRSQQLNVKVHTVAERLVNQLPSLLEIPPTERSTADHYLMTLTAPD
jgi:ANTAR domain/PAS fold